MWDSHKGCARMLDRAQNIHHSLRASRVHSPPGALLGFGSKVFPSAFYLMLRHPWSMLVFFHPAIKGSVPLGSKNRLPSLFFVFLLITSFDLGSLLMDSRTDGVNDAVDVKIGRTVGIFVVLIEACARSSTSLGWFVSNLTDASFFQRRLTRPLAHLVLFEF